MSARARILVVEDNAINLRLVRDLLTLRGHEVIGAASVAEARERLTPVPDLVLMDLQIPGGGGELALAEIRANPALEELSVVVVTASAMRGDRERLLRAGFNGYLSKPINVTTFGPTVESYLARNAHDD